MEDTSKYPAINKTIDHLFRNEAGKMVVVLTRMFGFPNIEQAEDIVQDTILKALQTWRHGRIPENPQAWLYTTAKNSAIDFIRRDKLKYKIETEISVLLKSEYTLVPTINELFTEGEIKDSQLRMMFACCNSEISEENQITLILKTLCGFSTTEIAKAFLTSEDTISKRLYRTKDFFRTDKIKLEIPSIDELKTRTNSVLNSIYLLFNEGYNSTHSENVIREDLIGEAMMLCKLLIENNHTQLPEVFALMALMCFHSARSGSRLTAEGEIILLPYQDRSKWNTQLIATGNQYMDKAAFGNEISSYHIEAAIAFEHCIADSFSNTNWKRILELYEWLCKIAPSPISELNKSVAVMQVHGAEKALQSIEQISNKKKLESFYLYHSLLGEVYCRLQLSKVAKKHFETAINLTQSESEKRILKNKINVLPK